MRVYEGELLTPAQEVGPERSQRKYWTRREIAEWLVARLSQGLPTLVGIDHAFSFPLRYFEQHNLQRNWCMFLEDFQHHWPTDEHNTYVDFIRKGICGNAAARLGDSRWRRVTEVRARSAKSVFHFDVPGSVAKSTHAGLPWLRFLRRQLKDRVHFWPFDGWAIPPNRCVIAEVYPSLWNSAFARAGRTSDQHDAFATAEWLRQADLNGTLRSFLCPQLEPHDRKTAEIEGWILGVA